MDDVEVDSEDACADLVDLTRAPVDEIILSDDTVLTNSLRRLLAEMDQPQEIIAAFDSYL